MKVLGWLVMLMTWSIAIVTVYQAATEGLIANVVIGFSLSLIGIWILVAIEQAIRQQ